MTDYLIQTHVNGATERTHGLTGMFQWSGQPVRRNTANQSVRAL